MTVRVEVDRERSNIDGKAPGSYTYTRGTRLSGFIKISNTGTEIVRARAYVYDEENAEEIWVSDVRDLYPNQSIQGDFNVTVDKDRRVTMYAQYYDAIRDSWRSYDIYGSWELQFSEAPQPTEEPQFEFLSFEVPQTAKPGETITLNVVITNRGSSGDCRIELGYYDGISDKRTETVTIISGGRYSTKMDIKIPEDYKESYLNVYGDLYAGDKRTDHKLVTVKVSSEEQPPEEEQPTEEGNIVVTATLTKAPVRPVYVAFYKGNRKLKEGTLNAQGKKISVEVKEHTTLTFVCKKVPGLFSKRITGVAESGKTAVEGFGYEIVLSNFNIGKDGEKVEMYQMNVSIGR